MMCEKEDVGCLFCVVGATQNRQPHSQAAKQRDKCTYLFGNTWIAVVGEQSLAMALFTKLSTEPPNVGVSDFIKSTVRCLIQVRGHQALPKRK